MPERSAFLEELRRYYALWHAFDHTYEAWAKARGLSLNELTVLEVLCESTGDCTQKKICEEWLLPKQTVNMILKGFVEKGYVTLRPMERDKRSKALCLTAAGRAYADAVLSELQEMELYAAKRMGLARMRRMNEICEEFLPLFKEAGGQQEHEANV